VATTYMGVLVITKRRGIGNDREGGCWLLGKEFVA
jgi:hypothetical protein